jgi:hypothetical protein
MASSRKACFVGHHLSQPGTHCPRSGHCNYSVVLLVYYPFFIGLRSYGDFNPYYQFVFIASRSAMSAGKSSKPCRHGRAFILFKQCFHIITYAVLQQPKLLFLWYLNQLSSSQGRRVAAPTFLVVYYEQDLSDSSDDEQRWHCACLRLAQCFPLSLDGARIYYYRDDYICNFLPF